LTVADGESCGKTAPLRMLAGLERITAGEIRIGVG
jgi:ABC-type sugar transport system ATPase subunit